MRRRPLATGTLVLVAIATGAHTAAQDGATALQQNYRTVLDNDRVQVVRVHYAAHQELPVHDHSHYPTVYVYLSNSGPVRFVHDEAHSFALTRRPVRTGWFRVSPGRIERHEVANLGPLSSDFLRVECKRIPLGEIGAEFRFSHDVDQTKTGMATDYASPEMVIRRYVIVPGGVENVAAEQQPELLIAFTPTSVQERGQLAQTMANGAVLWLKDGSTAELKASGSTAAHLLTIRLLK